jgi:hypothetical protein
MYTLVIADGSNESSRATSLDYPESRIPLVNSASDEFVTKGIWAVKTSAASMKSQIVGRGLKVKRVVGGRLGSVIQMPTSVVGGKLGSAFEAFNGIRRRKNSTVAGVASGGRGEGHGGSHTSAQGKEGDEGERDVGREEKSGEGGGERRGLMGLKKAQLLGKFRAGLGVIKTKGIGPLHTKRQDVVAENTAMEEEGKEGGGAAGREGGGSGIYVVKGEDNTVGAAAGRCEDALEMEGSSVMGGEAVGGEDKERKVAGDGEEEQRGVEGALGLSDGAGAGGMDGHAGQRQRPGPFHWSLKKLAGIVE